MVSTTSGDVRSWGGFRASNSRVVGAETALRERQGLNGFQRVLPIGAGRSYGDSALLDDGVMLATAGLSKVLSFDASTGLLTAEAGLMLSDLLRLVVPRGWFVPVAPGTRFVTLGGMLANDVHGKNHHGAGTFGRHVRRFALLRSDRERALECSPSENADLFAATIGGMGLTGLITELSLQLVPVRTSFVRRRALPFAGVREALALFAEHDGWHEYSVAWLDAGRGGGLLFLGDHVDAERPLEPPSSEPRWRVPAQPPVSLLNRATVGAFNALYCWREGRSGERDVPMAPFFWPLDGVAEWRRAYGPRGLLQHQSVVPLTDAARVYEAMLAAVRSAGETSFLTVLKRFGALPSPGLMSFPREGATLTLDFPHRGRSTLALLDRLDALTVEAGGRVNPYKDGRMSPATFRASFPQAQEFARSLDAAFTSNFWERVR